MIKMIGLALHIVLCFFSAKPLLNEVKAFAPAYNFANIYPDQDTMPKENAPIYTLVITGTFDKTGSRLLKSNDPVSYDRPLKKATPDLKKGRFAIIVKYKNSQSLEIPFDARISSDEQGPVTYGFFEVQVPVSGPIKWVAIRDKEKNKEIIKYYRIHSAGK